MRMLIFIAGLAAAHTAAIAADKMHPVVVELYQSQGCSSCPPADLILNALADRPDLLALNFAVTYWDQLGWKDTFASPAYTGRQWDYAHAGGRREVATPQMILNGRSVVTGNRRDEVDTAIAREATASGPSLNVSASDVIVGAGHGSATVWLVRYDPHTINVSIRAGENGGRTIPHRNIVRQLTALGQWAGRQAKYAIPQALPGLASAIILQAGVGGPIIAARKLSA